MSDRVSISEENMFLGNNREKKDEIITTEDESYAIVMAAEGHPVDLDLRGGTHVSFSLDGNVSSNKSLDLIHEEVNENFNNYIARTQELVKMLKIFKNNHSEWEILNVGGAKDVNGVMLNIARAILKGDELREVLRRDGTPGKYFEDV